MSYILDALKKSEVERGRGDAVALGATAAGTVNRWRYVVVALLSVNIGLVGFWLIQHPDRRDFSDLVVSVRQVVATTPSNAATADAPAANPQTPTVAPATEIPSAVYQAPRPSSTTADMEAVALGSLPKDDRSAFPKLVFSTHIYADTADLRAVFINGERHVEGDRVSPEVVLQTVTESGVELVYRSHLVGIDVLQEWE